MASSLMSPAPKESSFEAPEPGAYIARCFQLIDVGTQEVNNQYGQKDVRQIIIGFELLKDSGGEEVRNSSGRPFTVTRTFTWSLHSKSSLRKFVNAWRGKALTDDEARKFDIAVLIGQPAFLQIIQTESATGSTWTNIDTIMSYKGDVDGVNKETIFSVNDQKDMQALDQLPEWMQEKVRHAQEWGSGALKAAEETFGQKATSSKEAEEVQF